MSIPSGASVFALCIALIGLSIVLANRVAESQQDPLDRMAQLTQHKERAEELARWLKEDKDKITKQDFKNCQILYGDARSVFNGWIEQAETDILRSTGTVDPRAREDALRIAVGKSLDFTDTTIRVLKKKPGGRGLGPVELNIDIEKMIRAAWDIMKEVRSNTSQEKQKLRNELMQRLEHLKWKKFDEL